MCGLILLFLVSMTHDHLIQSKLQFCPILTNVLHHKFLRVKVMTVKVYTGPNFGEKFNFSKHLA